jgi:membrane-bound serine protease (ClpP class)
MCQAKSSRPLLTDSLQSKFSSVSSPAISTQTVKIDLAVFTRSQSRVTAPDSQQASTRNKNHSLNSLFHNILSLSFCGSIFYGKAVISVPRNSNKAKILPERSKKNVIDMERYAGLGRRGRRALLDRTAEGGCLYIISALLLIFPIIFILLSPSPAAAEVVKITVDDTIQPISQEYITRAIDEAHRRNAQAILIEMNTPGGLVSSTREIIDKITKSSVPVIVYVTPTGGHAGSAGIFILESADIAAMAPGTAAGAAHPVAFVGPVQVKEDDEMRRKVENDAAALMRSVTSKRGRNIEAAESAVRESKSFTEQEALAQHLIDYVAPTPEDLFRQMQGKTFKRFNGESGTLNLTGQPIVAFDMTVKERILDTLMEPDFAFLLLVIGALALYIEFNHPGAVIPGTVGVVFILLAIFALNLLPTRFAALGLILGAFALFAAEAKFATHGVLTVGGIVLLTLGGLLLVDSPIPEMRVHLLTALAVSIPFGLITAFLMSIALKARRNKVVTGAQGLVGETGVAQTALSPQGKVFVHGELWDAVASSALPVGQMVIVRRVDGLVLEVEPLAATAPPISPATASF